VHCVLNARFAESMADPAARRARGAPFASARNCFWRVRLLMGLILTLSLPVGVAQSADSSIDQRLGESVATMLEAKTNVSVRGLAVSVQDGIVTLEGTVKTSAEKHLASRYSQDIVGVQGVVNAIVVEPAMQPR